MPAGFGVAAGHALRNTAAEAVAASVAASVVVAVVWLAFAEARRGALDGPVSGGAVVVQVAGLASAGAAAIHLAVARSHFDEYVLFGLFFVGSGVAQLVWALAVAWRPSPGLLLLAVAGNAAIVALWAVDRIWGLPIGPEHWTPEPVGFADSAASALELVTAVGCWTLLVGSRSPVAAARTARPTPMAVPLVVIAVTALALLSGVGAGSSLIPPSA